MLALKQNQSQTKATQGKVKLRWDVLFGDLSLLFSMTVARFIVWITLRRHRQERAARRQRFRLVRGNDDRAGQRVVPS
jgi:hypothetical protein